LQNYSVLRWAESRKLLSINVLAIRGYCETTRVVCRKTLLGVIVRLEDEWNHKGTKNTKKKRNRNRSEVKK